MKYNFLLAIFSFLFFSCSSISHNRQPTSAAYQCHFDFHYIDQNKDDHLIKFNLTPEASSMVVTANTLNIKDQQIELVESDFTEGGFVYRSIANDENHYDLQLTFISYQDNPQVNMTLNHSPISSKPLSFTSKCSTK